MKLRSDFVAVFIAFFLSVFNFNGTMKNPEFMPKNPLEQPEAVSQTPVSSSGGSSRSSVRGSRQNPLTPAPVGEWGLYMPDQILSFKTHQWVNNNGSGRLYFKEIKSNPEGIVNTWIDGDRIRIQANKLGKTTVTAIVYSTSGHTLSNSVNIEVKYMPDGLYKIRQDDIHLFTNDVKRIHKTDWVRERSPDRIWLESVKSSKGGIVDTWIDGDSFYIRGMSPGETTVTAYVYTDYDFIMSNQVKVTVTESVYGK